MVILEAGSWCNWVGNVNDAPGYSCDTAPRSHSNNFVISLNKFGNKFERVGNIVHSIPCTQNLSHVNYYSSSHHHT